MTLYEILASGEFSGETILKFPTKPIFFEKSCEIPQIEFYRFAPESVVFPMTFIAKKNFQGENLESSSGGGGESRTPVRKQLDWNFSGRSPLFTFPHPDGNGHPAGFGSFMMHGAGKAYRTHGLHSNHTRARLVDLPGRMGA